MQAYQVRMFTLQLTLVQCNEHKCLCQAEGDVPTQV